MLKLLLLSLLCLSTHCAVINNPDPDTISLYIKALLENLKQEMPNGIPELSIPPLEPLQIPEIDIPPIKEGIASVELDMKNFELQGLSGFRVESAKGDTQNLGIDISLYFPLLQGKANYNLDGKVLIFPLYGNGLAQVMVNDFRIRVRSGFSIANLKQLQLTDLRVEATFSQVQLYLEGIVGGGNLGDLVNMLLNSLGKLVFDKTKHLFLPEISRIIRGAVNHELTKVNIEDIIGGILPLRRSIAPVDDTANIYVDRLMEELRPHIVQNNLDPLAIPDQVASFSKKILLVTVRGSARLTGGRAAGLSTIHRAGNCNIGNAGTRISVDCVIGVNGMHGGFNAHAEFMGIGVGARVDFGVSRVRVRFVVSAEAAPGAVPNLDHFSITEVSAVGVRISGLGPLDWILNTLANVVVNAVKPQIVRAIEGPVRSALAAVLRNVQIPEL